MTKFFNKFKKPYFWPIFGPILAQNFYSKNPGSVTHIVIRVSSAMPKFQKKLMIQFQENTQTDRWIDPKERKSILLQSLEFSKFKKFQLVSVVHYLFLTALHTYLSNDSTPKIVHSHSVFEQLIWSKEAMGNR